VRHCEVNEYGEHQDGNPFQTASVVVVDREQSTIFQVVFGRDVVSWWLGPYQPSLRCRSRRLGQRCGQADHRSPVADLEYRCQFTCLGIPDYAVSSSEAIEEYWNALF
jgi:hypothetical protein